jgi:hypothetical protein
MKHILALGHVRKSYNGKVVLDNVTLGFLPGAKIGVVRPEPRSPARALARERGRRDEPGQ